MVIPAEIQGPVLNLIVAVLSYLFGHRVGSSSK